MFWNYKNNLEIQQNIDDYQDDKDSIQYTFKDNGIGLPDDKQVADVCKILKPK